MIEYADRDSAESESIDTANRTVCLTSGGKRFNIFLDRTGYYKVRYSDGGQLPSCLTGKYTDYYTAEQDIKLYVDTKHRTASKRKTSKSTKE